MDTPSVQFAPSSDGVNVAYWVIGHGPAVVTLHELATSHIQLEWDFPEAREGYERVAANYSLVRLDLRNNGLSTRGVPAASVDDLVRDLEAVVERLPDKRITLVGSRAQSKVALAYVAKHPEKVNELVLSQAVIKPSDLNPINDDFRAIWPIAKRDWKLFTELASVMQHGLEDSSAQRFAPFMREAVDADDLRHGMAAFGHLDATSLLPVIDAPTLVLHGTTENLSLAAAQEAASLLRRSRR